MDTKPLRSTIIHIRSKDATDLSNGIYNTHFAVEILDPILSMKDEEIHIQTMSVEIPYSFYNISTELQNNILTYDTNQTLTFTSQNYNINDLISFFVNDTTGFASIFSTTYNRQKNQITFTNTTSQSHTINFASSTINKVIGFDESSQDVTIAAGASVTSPFVCNLATVHSILMKCSVGQGNVLSTRAGNSQTLQKISCDTNFGGIIYLNQQDFRQISISQAPVIDVMEFRFTDQNNNLLQLNSCNFEFSILFEVYSRRTIPTRQETVSQSTRRRIGDSLQRQVENSIDDTHPIQNTTEVEHKGKRLVLDALLDTIAGN